MPTHAVVHHEPEETSTTAMDSAALFAAVAGTVSGSHGTGLCQGNGLRGAVKFVKDDSAIVDAGDRLFGRNPVISVANFGKGGNQALGRLFYRFRIAATAEQAKAKPNGNQGRKK